MKASPPHTDWFSGAFDVTWPQDGVHFWQLPVNVCDHKLPKSASDVLGLICFFFFNYILSHIDDGARIPWFSMVSDQMWSFFQSLLPEALDRELGRKGRKDQV